MKIALVTLGTHGDVQPFIALGKAVVPDYPAGGPENIWTTGYWFLDEDNKW